LVSTSHRGPALAVLQRDSAGTGLDAAIAFPVNPGKIELMDTRRRSCIAGESGFALPRRRRSGAALLALLLFAAWGHAAAQQPVRAVWKERELQFTYRASAGAYRCGELPHTIARVLAAVGARPDLQVTIGNCSEPISAAPFPENDVGPWPSTLPEAVPGSEGTGLLRRSSQPAATYPRRGEPRRHINVQVRLSVPAEVTPAVLAELETDKRRRELISQVTGDPLPWLTDPIEFAAQRRLITLSHETVGLEPADCELMEQMVTSGLRELGVQVVRRGYACNRDWTPHPAPTLVVEALVPVPLNEVSGPRTSASRSAMEASVGD